MASGWLEGHFVVNQRGASEIEGQVGGLTPQHHKNQCNLNACQRSLSMFYDSDLKIKLRHIHFEDSEDGG